MKEKAKKIRPGLIAGLIIILWSSCAVEYPFSGTSDILTRFGLKSTAAMDGKITIGETYLKPDRIEVTGSFGGKTNPSATHSVSPDEPPYNLSKSDSSHVNLSVQSRAYDQLDLHLFLKQEDYQLVFLGENVQEETAEVPQGEEETPDDNGGNADADHDSEPGNNGDGENGNGGGGDETADDSSDEEKEDKGEKEDDDEEDRDDDDDGDKEHDDDDDSDKDDDHGESDKGHKGDKNDDKKKDKDKDRGDDDDRNGDGKHDDDDDNGDDERKSSNANNSIVDLDHFFQNARPGLVVFGIYQNNGKVINLIFVVTDVEKISMHGRQNDNVSILLGAQNTAQVTFDPESWFESLAPAEIESASMQTYQQQTVLFIHPEYNPELYQSIVSKLDGSADLNLSVPETNGNL